MYLRRSQEYGCGFSGIVLCLLSLHLHDSHRKPTRILRISVTLQLDKMERGRDEAKKRKMTFRCGGYNHQHRERAQTKGV
jgi:hypothetical protein